MRIQSLVGTLLAVLLLGACGEDSDSGPKSVERQFSQKTAANKGIVCLSPRENGDVAVDVIFGACLSSSCDRPDGATCSAALDGDQLVVTSQLMFTSETTPNRSCTTDCTSTKVACGAIQPMGATLRVVHGADESDALTLPLAGITQVSGNTSGVVPGGACEEAIDNYFQ